MWRRRDGEQRPQRGSSTDGIVARFTPDARRLVVCAHMLALRWGQSTANTGHLLLAFVALDRRAGELLFGRLGADELVLRNYVAGSARRSMNAPSAGSPSSVPMAADLKAAFTNAMRMAGSTRVAGVGDLIAATLTVVDSVAVSACAAAGARPDVALRSLAALEPSPTEA